MADKKSIPIVTLIILIVVSLSLAGGVFCLLQKERLKNTTLQEELGDTKIKQRIAETKLAEAKNIISTLELKLQETQEQLNMLTGDLEQEKNLKQEALTQIEQLKVDLEQQKEVKSNLEKELNQTQKDMEKTQVKVNELESKKADLVKKMEVLEKRSRGQRDVQLGKIVVGPEGDILEEASVDIQREEKAPSVLEGIIVVINKDYNFVVINLGSREGVKVGHIFSVYHDDKYVCDVTVEKIHDSMSAAGLESAEVKNKVSEGDKVIQKTK